MRTPKPAGAKAEAGEALVTKADIVDIVQKAMAPLQAENAELRKAVQKQTDLLRKKDYESIAKSDFSELGEPGEVAEVLKSLEGMPSEARVPVIKMMKKTNAGMKEVAKMLYHPLGSNKPAPGSAKAEFEVLVNKHLGEIRKSHTGKSEKVLKAMAVTAASREDPVLAKAVDAEFTASVVRTQMGVQ